MPGLSQYNPANKAEDDLPNNALFPDEAITQDSPVFAADRGIFDRMNQRYADSFGFADLKRTAPDWMMQEMMRNIPRDQWDIPRTFMHPEGEPSEIMPGMYDQAYSSLTGYTLRDLMNALGKMNPTNEQQAP